MKITVCIGSSCHIKGSRQVVKQLQYLINENNLSDEVEFGGTFCTGKCNRLGVTVQVDDEIHTGITCENVKEFFNDKVLAVIENERK